MNNSIVTTGDIGNRDELMAFANRIGYMVKGGNKLNDNEKMALAQVAMVTKLNPFIGEVWYIPGSGPMIGIAGSRKLDNIQVSEKGGYTWEEMIPVDPADAGASAAEIKDVAAAFRCDIHDSVANAQYQALFISTLNSLRDAGTTDPFGEAKEVCGPRPVWSGYGYSLIKESSRMSKPQLACKRAHADALKKRIIVPFGGEISERDVAPAYDVDAEDVEMLYPKERRPEAEILAELGDYEAGPPIKQSKAVPHPDVQERPYSAEQVKIKVDERVKHHLEKKTLASANDRKVLASILDTVLEEPTKRYELCKWLVGQSSTQKMKQADVNALFDWLGTAKQFNAVPVPHVVKEIHAAHTAALKASGQQELI